jgi:diguanylate cyclase (GGDEF)-like protein
MAQTFSASLEVRDVVTLTVNRIERMVPFTTCVVYLRDEGDDTTVAAYVFGKNAGRIRGRGLAAGHGIAGWVVLNGRPMSNTDPMLDLNEFLSPDEAGYRTAAVFPLVKGDAAIGALALYTEEMDSYSSDHLHLLESVSRLTSTALQHAMLYEQTKASGQTDSLTGLPNGRALYARFESELTMAKEQGAELTVLSFNLSGMRAINDAYGYQAGDRVLVKAARRLSQVVGEQGLLSRIAGDEFTCLLRGAGRPQATRLGERAQSEVTSLRIEALPERYVRLGLSFGVAEYRADGQTADKLLHAAGAATRQNKLPPDKVTLISDCCEPYPAQLLHPQETEAEAVALIR